MKALLALTAVLALALPAAHAQEAPLDPAAVAATRELLAVMHYEKTGQLMIRQMFAQMPMMMRQSAESALRANPKLTDDERNKAIAQLQARMTQADAIGLKVMTDPSFIKELVEATIPLYAKHFTAEELKQMTAFYASPAGQKMLAEMPQIAGESMQVSQRVIVPRMEQAMQEFMKQNGVTK
ncbi:MAG: DUF2059 domain-containing protein [Telluria sp.]